MTFTVATWNILATAYIRPDYYPHTPPALLDPAYRLPALVRHAVELNADILCLQEVERASFAALDAALTPLGFSGRLAMKGARKPDGCATFFRLPGCRLLEDRRLPYPDGGNPQAANAHPDSGHIAQILAFDLAGVRLHLLNTHLKWDPPGTPRDRQWGYREASLALSALPPADGAVQIVCGDFNVTADSAVVRLFTAGGFTTTHPATPGVYTCNSGGDPKLIDYLLYRGSLRGPVRVEPQPLPLITSATPLPSAIQPSDHLPLLARFTL